MAVNRSGAIAHRGSNARGWGALSLYTE